MDSSFQSVSVKVAVPGSFISSILVIAQKNPIARTPQRKGRTHEAYELVRMILCTFGSSDAAFKIETVPATAGLMKSSGSWTFQWKGEAV